MLDVAPWVWAAVIIGLIVVLAFDLWIVDRGEPREFTMRQAGFWVSFYVTLAVLFGIGLLIAGGGDVSAKFFAGYLTEYSLSVDNLFVFYIIMTRFAVPRAHQHKVLLIGILIALVMRGAFIAVGAAAIARFSWLFYIFGIFLIYTAVQMILSHNKEDDVPENAILRFARRALPSTPDYHGAKIFVKIDGKRLVTPMLIVMIAIGTTDLLFAIDSIPAIFGLTTDPFIVFTANAFALMGLRQLYFLLGGLLERLTYLSYGLAFILGFIGVKLILEALHTSGVHWAPEISIWVSLSVIGLTMVVTTVASLIKLRRDNKAAASEAASITSKRG
ncbi:TerC family protein [Rhizohabitans arisaemae]|uniref:TerC family protein n=1 Tax=Rhizohabitans arisaemae TaxID=2720610 RepID=UPI0024B05519|nr:TerC family protein [Rhizohabitans arisaemae]